MRKVTSMLLVVLLGVMSITTNSFADAAKGQKYYLKKLKKYFDMNGTKFAASHSQEEWEGLFEGNAQGFIDEFSAQFPKSEKFLKGDGFQTIKGDVFDFAYKYANDSGEVPSCG